MLKVQPLNCTLKRDASKASSTDAMIAVLAQEFRALDVEVADTIRLAAHDVPAGVTSDEGEGDEWPVIREKILAADEDGAHFASAQIFQALNDVGWTIPAVAACYWVGEAMGSTDFKDLDETPEMVAKTAKMVAENATHLARLLKSGPYPGYGDG